MYDDTNEDTHGEDFIVKCGIVLVLLAEYEMVSEVSEVEDDFMPYEEQKTLFERPSPGMMYHMKTLFIRAKVDGITVKKVFLDGGASVNLMPYTLFKNMGKCDDDLRQHNILLSNYEGKTSNILGVIQVDIAISNKLQR